MTAEYILLLAVFTFTLLGPFIKVPKEAFLKAGPQLGARVERQLQTGDGFVNQDKQRQTWSPATK